MNALLLLSVLSVGQPIDGWRPDDRGGGWILYESGVRKGWLRQSDGIYYKWDGNKWNETSEMPPSFPPESRGLVGKNFGLDCPKINPDQHFGVTLPDDSGKLRVTVVGSEFRKILANSLRTTFKDKVVVKDYEPGHWAMQPVGFVQDKGDPTVYVQAPYPNQQVLHHGPEDTAVDALRKLVDGYKPQNDPNVLSSIFTLFNLKFSGINPWVAAGIGVLVFLILQKRSR